jgi:hypothetical protein
MLVTSLYCVAPQEAFAMVVSCLGHTYFSFSDGFKANFKKWNEKLYYSPRVFLLLVYRETSITKDSI